MMGVFVQMNGDTGHPRSISHPIGYLITESSCWEWVGARDQFGYGHYGDRTTRRGIMAHRWVYQQLRGPIPAGLQLDHLCRNRICVNPDHLEPVTAAVNYARGISFSAQNTKKTHCPQGHELTGDNLIPSRLAKGWRECWTCDRARDKSKYAWRRPSRSKKGKSNAA
jgi:hypothetical protein